MKERIIRLLFAELFLLLCVWQLGHYWGWGDLRTLVSGISYDPDSAVVYSIPLLHLLAFLVSCFGLSDADMRQGAIYRIVRTAKKQKFIAEESIKRIRIVIALEGLYYLNFICFSLVLNGKLRYTDIGGCLKLEGIGLLLIFLALMIQMTVGILFSEPGGMILAICFFQLGIFIDDFQNVRDLQFYPHRWAWGTWPMAARWGSHSPDWGMEILFLVICIAALFVLLQLLFKRKDLLDV